MSESVDQVKRRGVRWFDLPKNHPVRIAHVYYHTKQALKRAKAALDEDNPWRTDEWLIARQTDLQRAQRKHEAAHEAWENAGCPDRTGKRTV